MKKLSLAFCKFCLFLSEVSPSLLLLYGGFVAAFNGELDALIICTALGFLWLFAVLILLGKGRYF